MVIAPRVVGPRKLPVRQGSPEWLEARRTHITATDIPVLLGISPWRCEQDLADEKLSGNGTESTLRMRIGNALEDLIAEDYAEQTGRKVRRVRGLWESRAVPWAAASPDATAAGRLVELKWSGSRSRFAGGLPEDVEAQVQWQAFVAEVPEVDVAALTVGDDHARIFTVVADPATQANFVAIAADFRRRLLEGGPFAQSLESLKRAHPADDGSEIVADGDEAGAVMALFDIKDHIKQLAKTREALEIRIQDRMGPATALIGTGFRVTWKTVKDSAEVDWKAIAQELAPPEEVVARHTRIKPGGRRFLPLRLGKEDEE